MNEKIILVYPDGSQKEVDILCHFKSDDDDKPHIKGIPILVYNTHKRHDDREVVTILWQINGMYQSTDDEDIWRETKQVLVSIMNNNFTIVDIE